MKLGITRIPQIKQFNYKQKLRILISLSSPSFPPPLAYSLPLNPNLSSYIAPENDLKSRYFKLQGNHNIEMTLTNKSRRKVSIEDCWILFKNTKIIFKKEGAIFCMYYNKNIEIIYKSFYKYIRIISMSPYCFFPNSVQKFLILKCIILLVVQPVL